VDDVEDNSLLRRGVPVAHNIFGVAQTINTANYVYFQALAELTKLNNPDVLKIYTGRCSCSWRCFSVLIRCI
jgi:geranylgeranyl diphosphate synthase type 3